MSKDTVYYPNKDDWNEKFWEHNYNILLTEQGIPFNVNAACEGDAIDYVIDYCAEHLPGLVFTQEEAAEEEYIEDYVNGGNEGLYLSTQNIHITEEG